MNTGAFLSGYLGLNKTAKVLTTTGRKRIKEKNFAIPSKAEGKAEKAESGNYPIYDIEHARNALARSSGKSVEGQVRAKVYDKYPSLKKNSEKQAAITPTSPVAYNGANDSNPEPTDPRQNRFAKVMAAIAMTRTAPKESTEEPTYKEADCGESHIEPAPKLEPLLIPDLKLGEDEDGEEKEASTKLFQLLLKQAYGKKTPTTKAGKDKKVSKVMREFSKGELRSGSKTGPVVKSRKQGIAIAMSESGQSKKK